MSRLQILARQGDLPAHTVGPPVCLAPRMRFDGSAPRWFAAPVAHSWPHRVGDFSGSVMTGASCNCRNVQITPHGSGTHTEGVGHLTADEHHVISVLPADWLPAVLLHVEPVPAADTAESADFAPQSDDRLITAQALEAAWPAQLPWKPVAAVIGSGGHPWQASRADRRLPPYLTRECAQTLVRRAIWHVVVDLPSLDRLDDGGQLTAHRVFFGLPPRGLGTSPPRSAEATRALATITELADVPRTIAPGAGLLQLQAPAMDGDAVVSRPLWYPLVIADSA